MGDLHGLPLTKREYDCLLKLRRKPRTWSYLKKISRVSDDTLSSMLSDMHELYYVANGKTVYSGLLELNQKGETVAQAEYDRRFDRYYTRAISLAALLVSIAAIVVSVVFK